MMEAVIFVFSLYGLSKVVRLFFLRRYDISEYVDKFNEAAERNRRMAQRAEHIR
jgi:hypothetical protein